MPRHISLTHLMTPDAAMYAHPSDLRAIDLHSNNVRTIAGNGEWEHVDKHPFLSTLDTTQIWGNSVSLSRDGTTLFVLADEAIRNVGQTSHLPPFHGWSLIQFHVVPWGQRACGHAKPPATLPKLHGFAVHLARLDHQSLLAGHPRPALHDSRHRRVEMWRGDRRRNDCWVFWQRIRTRVSRVSIGRLCECAVVAVS